MPKVPSLLHDGSITLGVISRTGPMCQKTKSLQYICNISRESWLMKLIFCCWQMLKVFSNWYYHFRCVWPGMSKLPKITSLLFLYNMLRKKWVMQLMFYMQISMKSCCRLILRFFEGSTIPEVPIEASLQCLYNIPKNVRDEVDWLFWCR